MRSRIRKWGGSAGTVIPAAALKKSELSLGSLAEVEAKASEIVLLKWLQVYT